MKTHPVEGPAVPEPAPEDVRPADALSADENADLCAGCAKCCTYITIEIDAPRAAWEYDQWIWALHHRGIELYVEKPERWFIHVETVCEQLDTHGRCSIYGRHPKLCRDYDPRSCERRLPLGDIVAWFKNAYEFEAWLAEKRPSHFARLMAHRKDTVATPADAGSAPAPRRGVLIPVASLMASLTGRANGAPSTIATAPATGRPGPRKLR